MLALDYVANTFMPSLPRPYCVLRQRPHYTWLNMFKVNPRSFRPRRPYCAKYDIMRVLTASTHIKSVFARKVAAYERGIMKIYVNGK